MYLAYIDESGSTGDVSKGGSKSYTLGCILVRASQWAAARNGLAGYRLKAKALFGLLTHAEIKANYLLQNGGAFRQLALTERARYSLYRGMLRLCPKLDLKVFAIVINKQLLTIGDPHDLAWTLLLHQLARLTTELGVQALIVHDEGNDMRIRALAEQARRAGLSDGRFSLGHRTVPFGQLIEDPISRRSHESHFLQLADLVAYAAFRRVFPPPDRPVQVVPQLMWHELGSSTLVDQQSDWPSPGIIAWPRRPIEEEPPFEGGSEGRRTRRRQKPLRAVLIKECNTDQSGRDD